MENFLPFTDDVKVVLVHKSVQQTHLLALHLETLGYIPRILNHLESFLDLQSYESWSFYFDCRLDVIWLLVQWVVCSVTFPGHTH